MQGTIDEARLGRDPEDAGADPLPTVLVVDDDPDQRWCARELLEDQGYAVAEAADGRMALAYLRQTSAPRPVLVLLDLSMPIMSGEQFLAATAKEPDLASIPVLVVSGDEVLPGALESGAEPRRVLRKPYDGDELVKLVRRRARKLPRSTERDATSL